MNTEPTCNAEDDGRPCHRNAVALRPVPLCNAHRIEIALTLIPEVLRDQLATALRNTATPPVRNDLVATTRTATVEDLLHGVHDSVVYFIANGGRVKIGYTTNLKNRLGSLALRSDAVLLALHGGPELERALHRHFAQHRNGNTEWFDLAPNITRYIATQRPAKKERVVRPIETVSGRLSDTVRTAISMGKTHPDDVVAYARTVHGPDTNEDSTRRILRRLLPKAS
ncbi:GIY-YIG nuclease family protein [Streptomyces sp. NBRC 109706]|uniref:GIY-YIG nuclease family protein n=1 Tax=Streptomyces sp. NBRC 109706 TaxID=1550035 RepID=UPI000782EB01|nr:GIY-YIG nuclease family protein [Streptomyces sp. NBRC 109706]